MGYAGTAKRVVGAVVALTDAATINTDASQGNTFTVVLGGNRTMAAPTNPASGQKTVYRIKQDGSGGRNPTWPTGSNGAFRFGSGITSIDVSLAAATSGQVAYVGFIYNAADQRWDCIAFAKGY